MFLLSGSYENVTSRPSVDFVIFALTSSKLILPSESGTFRLNVTVIFSPASAPNAKEYDEFAPATFTKYSP